MEGSSRRAPAASAEGPVGADDPATRILLLRYRWQPRETPAEEDARAVARACAGLLRDEELETIAIGRLGSLGAHGLPYVEGLFELLSDPGPRGRHDNAASALVSIAASGGEAARLLADALDNVDVAPKLRILNVLGRLGPEAYCVVDRVRPLTSHPDDRVAKTATWAVNQIEQTPVGQD